MLTPHQNRTIIPGQDVRYAAQALIDGILMIARRVHHVIGRVGTHWLDGSIGVCVGAVTIPQTLEQVTCRIKGYAALTLPLTESLIGYAPTCRCKGWVVVDEQSASLRRYGRSVSCFAHGSS